MIEVILFLLTDVSGVRAKPIHFLLKFKATAKPIQPKDIFIDDA